jgi:hypothetical protein
MTADRLLLWMSARNHGSWSQFRSAVEELRVGEDSDATESDSTDDSDQYALPIYQLVRLNLQRLGHAEFFAGASDSDWRVTPPTIAIARHRHNAAGTLAGARSDRLLASIHDIPPSIRVDVAPMAGAPDSIRLLADDTLSLERAAKDLGLFAQQDAAVAILQSLPTVCDPAVRRVAEVPIGADWRVERFDERTLGWSAVARRTAEAAASGLFRYSFGHQRMVYWCHRGCAYAIPGQVGKYLAMRKRRRRVVRYDMQTRELLIPAPCRPPFLVERGIVACSGLLPAMDVSTHILRYRDVPLTVARLAAQLLGQELRL